MRAWPSAWLWVGAGRRGGTDVRRLVVLCALVVGLVVPPAGSAAGVTRFTDHAVSVSCEGMQSTTGTSFAFFGATLSDGSGGDAFLDAWLAPEPSGAPDLSRDFDQPVSVIGSSSGIAGSFPTIGSDGTAGGTATFAATLTPVGDPTPFNDRIRDGNHWSRFEGVRQAMQVEGTLTLPDGTTFDLATCFGDETTVTTTQNNPKSFVAKFQQRSVGCEVTNTAGDHAFLFVDLGEGGTFIDAQLQAASGLQAQAIIFLPPTTGTVETDLQLFNPENGAPAGTGHLSMTVTATGESFTELLRSATNRRIVRGEVLDIEGTLEMAGRVFDLGACVGQDGQVKEINTSPSGPKPGGKAPANDLPGGAKAIRPGTVTNQQTKGASPTAEAPYECLTFEDPDTGEVIETPVGNTVWFSFTGTGAPMTVDTAGSDYDTVIAIYTVSGSTLTPVPGGCVDDVPTPPVGRTLQAAATIDTVLGTRYFVQIGGFPDSFTYGNLRVALR